jgi:hypothetical protein
MKRIVRHEFPLWFTVLTAVLAISNFFVFGWMSLFDPTIPFKELGAGAGAFPVQFFAVRHIAMGVPLAYGLWKKNTTVLTTMYAMFLIVAVLDVSLLVINGYFIPIIGDLSTAATLLISIPGFIGLTSLGLWHLLNNNGRSATV